MSKQRNGILIAITLILILAVGIAAVFITSRDDAPNENNSSDIAASDVSSTISVEDIEDASSKAVETESSADFITPDETEADKILNKDNTSSKNETSSKTKNEEQKAEIEEPNKDNTPNQSFEEGQKELENSALDYLKEHNIDPKTAGETGEQCQNCNKKIWNPDKYGLFIPGMPEDYENSGYCLGTCGISLE